jgi:hypothetical protein
LLRGRTEGLLCATDYRYDDPDGRMKFADVRLLGKNPDISEPAKEQIRWPNAQRLFTLPG